MKTTINSTRKADAPLPLSALQLLAPPLRLMSAAMWKVMLQRDVVYYGKLEETVTSLCETVPGLLHHRHRARLTMGLRALMILEELRQSDPPDAQHVLQELEKLQSSSIPNGKRKDQKVEEAKRSFQTLVHSLLKSVDARKQFFKEEFHLHYGINYVTSLEKLLWEFLIRLDELLPVPDLAQTVSWLSGAPAVLEEYARSASQPQLLRTLLQHEKCLGHLGSTSLLSSTGDAILSSLSLPLSGKVQQTIQSKSLPTSKSVSNPAPATPRSTRRSAKQAQSQVTPVIGSISSADLQKSNEKAVSSFRQDETASEVSRKPSRELRSSSKGQTLEKDPKEDYYVGDMLVTVISQSSGSEVDDDDDDGEEKVESTESQEEAEISTLYISCMKRQLRVVVPRLNVSSDLPVHLNHQSDGNEKTSSPCQPTSEDCVGNRGSVLRKRKFMDSSATPEKRLTSSVSKLTSACSPCIPFVLRPPVGTPETPSPLVKSSGEYIEESDNETAGNVKRKVEFRQQYYKTKHGSYVPTLQEFWNPLCPTMSPESRR